MRHTSVRLSERHQELIESTGKSPSKVMREALDLYFKIKPEESGGDRMKALIQEHERTWHKVSTTEPPPESLPQNVPKKSAQRAQSVLKNEEQSSKDVPQSVLGEGAQRAQGVHQDVREDPVTLAERFILAELKAGREPTVQEVAEAVGMESRPLGRSLREAGFENVVCRRDGKQARRYTFDMKERLEGELEK
jgi:hypothetical protein